MNPILRHHSAVNAAIALTLVLAAAPAAAQTPAEPSAEQRRQAGAAFDSGQAARAQRDFVSAASFFETADRLAPSPAALGNAIESHRALHTPQHDARAATLALRLLNRYPNDARLAAYANRVIAELAPGLERVRVSCQGCDLEVDHALTSDTEFFVEPGPHTITASWSNNRTRSYEFTAERGGTEEVTLEAPPEAPATPSGSAQAPTGAATPAEGAGPSGTEERPPVLQHPQPAAPRPAPSTMGVLPPAIFVTGAVLTVASGALLIWSGIDTLAGVGPYEMNPTTEGLAEGQARELRTNILIGTTAGLGVLTLTTLFFTRWGSTHVEAAPAVNGATGMAPGLTLRGRF